MKQSIKTILVILILSFCIQLVSAVCRQFGGIEISTFIGFILYFIVVLVLNKKNKSIKFDYVPIYLILTIVIIQGPTRFLNFERSLITLPDAVFNMLGVITGWLFIVLTNKATKWAVSISMLSLTVLMCVLGYKYWFNKVNYATFNGITKLKTTAKIAGVLNNNRMVNDSYFSDKITLIDFWHTRCAACFDEFPLLEEISRKYKNNAGVSILALNKPLKNDTVAQAYNTMMANNYTFDILVPTDSILPEKFSITVYPTSLVLDHSGAIVYKGDLRGAEEVISKLLVNR